MGRYAEAVEHAREFVKTAPFDSKIDESMIARQKDKIAELLKKVGQIEVQAPAGTLINVDGRDLAEPPKETLAVAPGPHTVRGTLDGKTRTVSVAPRAGEVAKASFDFAAEDSGQPAAPPPAEGRTERTTLGWALPIGLGVLGLGGVVVGAAFGSASNSSRTELDRLGTPGLCAAPRTSACTAYEDKGSSMNTQTTLSWVGYGVGGAALVAAAVTFFVLPKARKESSTTGGIIFTPTLDLRHAGAKLELQF